MKSVIHAFLLALACLYWFSSADALFAQHGHGQDSGRHRNPADLKEYLEHLDRAERDVDQKPQEVIEALAIKPGMAVADLGSGSGYFTRRFAQAVAGTGKVYAVDIEPEMLAYARKSIERMAVPSTVEYILARPDDPKLPREAVDLVFVCNVYHHLEERTAYFAKVKPALKPGGRIAVIDFYHDERSGDVGFPKRHLVAKEIVISDMAKAGYSLLREHAFLPRQYFLEFTPAP